MKILGIKNMTPQELNRELQSGGKFVIYKYTISVVVMTFKRPSDIHFVASDENAAVKGLSYTIMSLLLGWWGIPWGPIFTIESLYTNLRGGKDVTREVIAALQASQAAA